MAASWWAEGADSAERFAAGVPMPEAAAEALLARWRASVGQDHWAKRLAWDGLDEGRLAALAAPPVDEAAPPEWAIPLEAGLALAAQPEGPWGPWAAWAAGLPEAARPFAEALGPFVAGAFGALRWPPGLLSPEAEQGLQVALLARLQAVALPCLEADWVAHRGELPEAVAGEAPGRARHAAWVAALHRGGGWPALLAAKPGLARLMGQALARGVVATQEVLDAIVADAPRWVARHGGAPWGQVVAWQGALSDPHDGGRCVVGVGVASGRTFFYKPRCLKLEEAFSAFLAWLEAEGLPLGHFSPQRLLAEGHGWVAEVAHAPCEDEAGVLRFFRRAGQLLAVIHALDGSDFHAENLIACGEFPVAIDLEGLLQPRLGLDRHTPSPFADADALVTQLRTSVLNTCFLSHQPEIKGGIGPDMGGLALPPARGLLVPTWLDAGTDRLRLEAVPTPQQRKNLPRLAGEPQGPTGPRREALLAGFEEAFALLLAKREAILAPGGPWEAFVEGELRLFFRDTQTYELLRRQACEPKHLEDGLGRRVALERLTRTYRRMDARPEAWPLIEAEILALEQGDIPAFRLPARAEGFQLPSGFVRLFEGGAWAQTRARFANFHPREGALQLQLIRIGLLPEERPDPGDAGREALRLAAEARVASGEHGPELDDDAALAAALGLLTGLEGQAVRAENGELLWLDRVQQGLRAPQPSCMRLGLWNGASGLAVAQGAAFALSGEANWRAQALATLGPVQDRLQEAGGLGQEHVDAWGSHLMALVALADLLQAPELLDGAEAAAGAVPLAFHFCQVGDVLGGLGSLAWGLAAVALARPSGATQAAALALGDRLLALGCTEPDGRRSWPSLLKRPLPGMGHGAAGVGVAFHRLFQATGEARFAEAAQAALDWEAAWWLPEAGSWGIPPEAPDGPVHHLHAWCHGAAGGALARVAVGAQARAEELEGAALGLLRQGDHVIDFACCGNAGRIEALLSAGLALGRPEWVRAARALAGRRQQAGPMLEAQAPSFLRGAAGIAYGLMRLRAPERLPNLLAGEAWRGPVGAPLASAQREVVR